jgi:cytoskeletal protein RodZ
MATQEETMNVSPAAWRVRQGISLEAVAASTKVSIYWLRAIEEAQFRKLPGGIYNASFIRQYASATGYDEETLLAACRRSLEPDAPAACVTAAARKNEPNRVQKLLRDLTGILRLRRDGAPVATPAGGHTR